MQNTQSCISKPFHHAHLKSSVSFSQHVMITYRKMSPLLPTQAAVHKTTVIWHWTKVHIVHFTLIEEVT